MGQVMSNMITLSDRAALKVEGLLKEEGDDSLHLRVFVTGGGCSGFSYGFTFDDSITDEDAVITKGAVQLVVDELSYQYLVGSVVDYREDLQGSRFLIENPNASTTCGCGNSFSL
jgi:iron-sulfur cluster insertion protein